MAWSYPALGTNGSATVNDPPTGKVYINGIEGFWLFAKERLKKFHRIDLTRFPFNIQGLEFKYNYRDVYLFDRLVGTLGESARLASIE